jgi:hypothetical protein
LFGIPDIFRLYAGYQARLKALGRLYSRVAAVVRLLEAMADPVARAIANAPLDNEPVTEEEEQALNESRERVQHNRRIPHEQVVELVIVQEGIESYQARCVKRIAWTNPRSLDKITAIGIRSALHRFAASGAGDLTPGRN